MSTKKWLLPLLAAAVVVVPAVPAHAMTWGGDVFGAFSTHTMDQWNSDIANINANGGNADKISNSFGGGIGLRLQPNPSWMIEGTWEPLFPKTEDKNAAGDKVSLSANSFQGTGTYFFPSQGKGKFGLGAGIGFYSLNGKAESPGSPSVKIGGNGVGFHILGTGEWEVSPGFDFFGAAGYRMAKISDTELAGQNAAARGTPKIETDFSGFTARAGLAFYMKGSSDNR